MNITRRQIIGTCGALVATGALADVPCFFPQRGKHERLNLGFQRIEIGLPQPFSVLHISDTHLTNAELDAPLAKQRLHRARTKLMGGCQEEALRDSLAWAKENADYVLHTGDLVDFQSEANLRTVKACFGEKVFCCPGNHDYSSDLEFSDPPETKDEAQKARTRGWLEKGFPSDPEFCSRIVNGVNFVMMDDAFGTFTARQAERFAAEVKKGLPIVLCVHVPLYTDKIWQAQDRYWNRLGRRFESAAVPAPDGSCARQRTDPVTMDFLASLRAEPLLKGVLAGHVHMSVQDRFSSTAMEYVVGANFLFHGQEVLFV